MPELVPSPGRVHPIVWITLALGVLGLEFLTGPDIRVGILFVFPVALATWNHGRLLGSAVAVALPLVRVGFRFLVWHLPGSWTRATQTAIDIVVLLALVQVIDYIAQQRRELHVLEGMLPICGFCKRIRDPSGGWHQMERYIAQRSEAQFTHTFCPECERAQFGDLPDRV